MGQIKLIKLYCIVTGKLNHTWKILIYVLQRMYLPNQRLDNKTETFNSETEAFHSDTEAKTETSTVLSLARGLRWHLAEFALSSQLYFAFVF